MSVKLQTKHVRLAKKLAIKIWSSYDDTYGYATNKKLRNESVDEKNIENIYFFIGQFDFKNQNIMWELAKTRNGKTGKELAEYIKNNYLKQL